MSGWDDLVQVYEGKLDVLEEARSAFAKALSDVMEETGRQLDALSRASEGTGGAYVAGPPFSQSDPEASFADGFRRYVPFDSRSSGAQFRIGAWVASCLGGPPNTLRLVLSLESLPGGLLLPEWTAKCSSLIPADAPGAPFALTGFPDVGSDGRALRICTIDLVDREARGIAAEVAENAAGLVGLLDPLVRFVDDAALPMTRAEQELLAYRPTLEARAAQVAASVSPVRGLAEYRGGKYLQVGRFWLCTAPDTGEFLVEGQKGNETLIHVLAERLGRETIRRTYAGCVLLTEQELRDPECDVHAAIVMAFDAWFEARETMAAEESSEEDDESEEPDAG